MAEEFTPKSAGSIREFRVAVPNDPELGPLKHLPGTWANIRPEHRKKVGEKEDPFQEEGTLTGNSISPYDGCGFNLIALPFAETGQGRNYRLLLNQYNEVLSFAFVDDNVPNRGIVRTPSVQNADQSIAALDYTQAIKQIDAIDRAPTKGFNGAPNGLAGDPLLAIHHEPGFFLYLKTQRTDGVDIARLASIPHGNALTALGRSTFANDGPDIPDLGGYPEGVSNDIEEAVRTATSLTDYLNPYNLLDATPFKGTRALDPNFGGFIPSEPMEALKYFMPKNVLTTTTLEFDTETLSGGIANIPFIERQADATSMKSTFWLMEVDEEDVHGNKPRLVLAYAQFIFLDFFGRFEGRPGRIRWPHISINVMEKIAEPEKEDGPSPMKMAV